ncbi:MAG TPA: VWA-like domain-containing protein, partial [Byssovorax sp.]
ADPAAAASQAVDKIAAARVWLLKEKPFFGVLARALEVRPSLEVAAFRLSVDDKLAVNPLVVLELAFPALCARLSHVALHAALGAYARRGPRDALKWNVAHDLAIDPLLRAGGLPTSEGLPDFDLPKGSAAEHYYAALPDGARPDDLWCDVSDPPPKDDAPPAGSFTREDDPEGSSPGEGDTKGGQRPSAEGEPEPGEEGEERPSDGDDDDPLEARARELQWKMRLGAAMEEEAASGGKTFGDAPAWIDELLEATIEPPPDWSAILQRSISMLARTERSFLRPSRRMAALAGPDGEWPDAVAMPGRRVVPAGRLVAVVDTSASMESADLARFLGALAAVASAEGFDEIRLLQADAEVTRDETVYAAELLFEKIEVVGRGGTDFRPALERLEADARRELERYTVVYLTDLEGTFPAKSQVRALDVLWVTPRKVTSAPPFGRAVTMAAQRG